MRFPKPVTFDKLVSWSEREDVRYFSGTATYAKEIEVPAGRQVTLDLGVVKNVAEVRLNGKACGVLWKPPFRMDVTGAVRPGKNRLEVDVTNLWPNRLIGDEQLPDDCDWGAPRNFQNREVGRNLLVVPNWLAKGTSRTSGRQTFSTFKFFMKDSPLLESGLLGPVVLEVTDQ